MEVEVTLAEFASDWAELESTLELVISLEELELTIVVIDLLRFEFEEASIEASVSNFCITDVAEIDVSSTPDSTCLLPPPSYPSTNWLPT